MRNDLYSNLAVDIALADAAYDADNTPAVIDLKGFAAALLVLSIGVGGITFTGTNKVEYKLTHANAKADGSAPDAGDYVAVTVNDLLGVASVGTGGIIHSLMAAHAAATVHRFGYRGGKRYLKLLADFSGTHGVATPMSAVVIKGISHLAPLA